MEIITCDPFLHTMDYSKCTVSNQKEESLSSERVKIYSNLAYAFRLWSRRRMEYGKAA